MLYHCYLMAPVGAKVCAQSCLLREELLQVAAALLPNSMIVFCHQWASGYASPFTV
jgi:hypothetical protein